MTHAVVCDYKIQVTWNDNETTCYASGLEHMIAIAVDYKLFAGIYQGITEIKITDLITNEVTVYYKRKTS